jgi:hypothetical protein
LQLPEQQCAPAGAPLDETVVRMRPDQPDAHLIWNLLASLIAILISPLGESRWQNFLNQVGLCVQYVFRDVGL